MPATRQTLPGMLQHQSEYRQTMLESGPTRNTFMSEADETTRFTNGSGSQLVYRICLVDYFNVWSMNNELDH